MTNPTFTARLAEALSGNPFTENPALIAPFRAMCEGIQATRPGSFAANERQPAPIDGDISDAEMFARDLQFHGESGDGWQDEEDTDAHDSHGYDPAYDD